MANLFLTGNGLPTNAVGEVTDYYRDTTSNLIYYRAPTGWEVVPSLVPTPDGVGTNWLFGEGIPDSGLGEANDYYRDDSNGIIYRKHVTNGWEAKGELDFIGVYGVQWGEGIGAPANIPSLNNLPAGSFYLDVATSDIYYKNNTLTWSLKGQLGGGSLINVIDNLSSTSAADALSANQGKVLKDEIDTKCPLVNGKVPSANLPSYVDDVLEYANLASFPNTGETGKLYIALDTNLIYRWTGSTYASTNSSLALGETSETAYRGDRGATAYNHSQATGNPHNVTKSDIGLANVDNTSDANKPISSATQTALDAKASIANQRYVFVSNASTTYIVPASAVTANGNTIIELSNNSLTSITINAATATGKTAGDSVTLLITGTYAAQLLVASGVTLNGTLAFSANAKIKTLIYRGSNTWTVLGG